MTHQKSSTAIHSALPPTDPRVLGIIYMTSKRNLAWHFVGDKLRDGSPLPKVGKWEHYSGKLQLCNSGLHWSHDPFDALQYAPGATLCMVELDGDVTTEYDTFDALNAAMQNARIPALTPDTIRSFVSGHSDISTEYADLFVRNFSNIIR